MSQRVFSIVVAQCNSGGIGLGNALPWNLPADLKRFKLLTTGTQPGMINAVVMGRKTYESLPPKYRPLPNRLNIVLSRNPGIRDNLQLPTSVLVAKSLGDLNTLLSDNVDKVFVIGGESIYREALNSPLCTRIFLTQVLADVQCDKFFPTIPAMFYRLSHAASQEEDSGLAYRFFEFERLGETTTGSLSSPPSNDAEMQYLDILRDIIDNGVLRGDRTGTGTLSKFGVQMRFSLRDEVFPLLTTKKVFWRGVAEELLWFVKGSTNANELAAKDIHIWDGAIKVNLFIFHGHLISFLGNGSREFLDGRGLAHHEEGDLGPVYGFQWRHFGAEYRGMKADYTGHGIDQLMQCIETIKKSPEDRRIVLSAWNPADIRKMALPPCHMFCQFYVANGELSCQMYQRSADMGLGVPFNIASYALLTRMVAQVCGLKSGDFVHTIGDAHVYTNHVEGLKLQIARVPRAFPRLKITADKAGIDDFTFSDFTIEDYDPYPTIKMQMAV